MSAFAAALPDWELVQRTVAQLREDPIRYIARALPEELEGSFPTIEQIEAELSGELGRGDE